jgi:hypothetical protein
MPQMTISTFLIQLQPKAMHRSTHTLVRESVKLPYNEGSEVSMATGCGLDDRRVGVRVQLCLIGTEGEG